MVAFCWKVLIVYCMCVMVAFCWKVLIVYCMCVMVAFCVKVLIVCCVMAAFVCEGADRILEMLAESKGTTQERVALAKDIRKEALRFKRHKLVTQIDSWIQSQLASDSSSASSGGSAS